MKEKLNEWVKSILGTIVTLGIFSFYFMENAFNTATKFVEKNTPIIIIVIITITAELLIIKIFSKKNEKEEIKITSQALLPMLIIFIICFIKITTL